MPVRPQAPSALPGRTTEAGKPGAIESERPTSPSVVRVVPVPGGYLVAIATQDGTFVCDVPPGRQAPFVWRQLASPHAPLSRDISLAQRPDGEVLAGWSDQAGVLARIVTIETGDDGSRGELHLGPS